MSRALFRCKGHPSCGAQAVHERASSLTVPVNARPTSNPVLNLVAPTRASRTAMGHSSNLFCDAPADTLLDRHDKQG
eukprot:CAMPEP_0183465070 /NCGR_PEP_ID=MMETSP0370-20130417/146635_1 /TAXON_ID=268820 /ORGANISM="Peridinium aciculiferum, Strain PAER-2" /LENGTH=76 /DNA_ID=CAMNT_0025657257 /DNA_START=131 /DNA_END=357 /DNA_ORIENTATION=+